jgi:hypothetical protein
LSDPILATFGMQSAGLLTNLKSHRWSLLAEGCCFLDHPSHITQLWFLQSDSEIDSSLR